MSHDLTARAGVDLRAHAQQFRISHTLGPLVVASVIIGTAAAQGGYFPTSWGWAALGLAWPLGVAVVVLGGYPRLPPFGASFLIALAGLFVWITASSLWSSQPWESVLEAERVLIYLLGAALVLLVARRDAGVLYGAILCAIAAVAAYGLATRLFPERLGVVDPVANYRLAEPIGYWNGLAIFAAMGSLFALGAAANGRSLTTRAGAAALLPLLLVTQYFTFSRAGWLALGIGVTAAVMFDRRSVRMSTLTVALAVPSALAVLAASRQSPLTHIGAPLPEAAHSGHRLALLLVVLAAASATIAVVVGLAERAVTIEPRVRRAYAALLVATALVAVTTVVVTTGGPVSLAKRAYGSFTSSAYVPPETAGSGTNLDKRLFSFSGNGRAQFWRVAWQEYRSNPWLGSGSGTFQSFWLPKPDASLPVHDAHGLYIETLAEIGPIGLALLLAVVLLPIVAAARARPSPFTAGAVGAYLAFFVHAGVDWDWELGGVTLAAICTGALLASLGSPPRDVGSRYRFGPAAPLALLAPLSAFAFVAVFGNSSLAGSRQALEKHDWSRAEERARRARTWMPWSPEPWTSLGEAQLGAGDKAGARASFRHALTHGGRDWEAWLGLARASDGAARASALAEARRLNAKLEAL